MSLWEFAAATGGFARFQGGDDALTREDLDAVQAGMDAAMAASAALTRAQAGGAHG